MKKTEFKQDLRFSVAMSQQTGCVVMVKDETKVVGSLTREQSVVLAQGLIEWQQPLDG